MKLVYKITDIESKTRNNTLWGEGVSHTAPGHASNGLCSDGYIHYYPSALLAAFMYEHHLNYVNPLLWEAEATGSTIIEPLKCGSRTLKTLKMIELPKLTDVHRVTFAILCAKEVYSSEKWNTWADDWLLGKDRTKTAARAAYAVCATCDNDPNAAAAACSVYACCAFYAVVDNAANAAANAANANNKIDFVSLAEKAVTYK